MIAALIGTPTRTNVQLAYAWRELGVDARVLRPEEAPRVLGPGDVAITRLDVLPTLDGVEPGLEIVALLPELGVRVVNRPTALLAVHDKLLTARRLARAGLPRPWTAHVRPRAQLPAVPFPCVVKPRYGSWGQDVFLCHTAEELERTLALVAGRPWWRRHGALVQELVAPTRSDVRVVVAGERVVAAARRIAAEDEWRTNVTLGGTVVRAELPAGTERLALAAAQALGIDFASVDLLPVDDGWVVLELNGAVDFDSRYTLPGLDPYAAILDGLGIEHRGSRRTARRGTLERARRKEETMAKTVHGKPARPGDEIVIAGHSIGDAPRTAVILEVLGEPGHERFRVRWEDGHESIFFPGDDAVIRRPRRRAKSTA
ncbi:MAG TPA: RimK family alpha-L-glutamate ligase [Gaiellaceae bacterium]|nr:RimK family alpha-L-glutamate ligase [Gaiellaceae bacterium]